MSPTGYALITGGGSGIGRAFCHALAHRGWTVAIVDRCGDAAGEVAEELAAMGHQAVPHVLDVTDAAGWRQLHDRLRGLWPRLDLLVNNAGTLLTGTLDDCPNDDLRRLVEVNLLGAMYGCRTMLPWLRASRSDLRPTGVINVSSIFAAVSPPGFAAYNATKAGVLALTETLRGELRPCGLNATVVLPGVTPTRLFERAQYANPAHVNLCQRFLAKSKITAEQVAAEALAGAGRGRLYVVVGRRSRWYWRLKRLMPQALIDLVGRRAVNEFGVLDGPAASDVERSASPSTSEAASCST